jgi:adenine C2-methylase RlmN of 23S rRNA A2503 and tRNA A37
MYFAGRKRQFYVQMVRENKETRRNVNKFWRWIFIKTLKNVAPSLNLLQEHKGKVTGKFVPVI